MSLSDRAVNHPLAQRAKGLRDDIIASSVNPSPRLKDILMTLVYTLAFDLFQGT